MQKTAIIIPCYNESKRLRVNEFLTHLKESPDVCFIFVNDGSSDNTLEVIYHLQKLNPERIFCQNLEDNVGKAEAVRQGFLLAFESEYERIGYWDADLSTPLYLIQKFNILLNENSVSIVMGSRVRLLGHDIKRRMVRHYLGRIFATIASLMLGLHVYDTQCGAKIFANNSELEKVFAHPFLVRWIFDVEILARYKILREIGGLSPIEEITVECPLDEWTEIGGSKVKFFDFFKATIEIAKIYMVLHLPFIKKKYSAKLLCG